MALFIGQIDQITGEKWTKNEAPKDSINTDINANDGCFIPAAHAAQRGLGAAGQPPVPFPSLSGSSSGPHLKCSHLKTLAFFFTLKLKDTTISAMDPPSTSTDFEPKNATYTSRFPDFTAAPKPTPAPPVEEVPEGEIRTCRICFDQVAPPYPPDEELGRLISPCVCKGSSRFVHQGCLQQWRLISANQTNFYQCPTCHYQYRFRRLKLAAVVGSSGLRFGITSGIMLLAVYLLGFVSEPIINAYLDPPALILSRPQPPPPLAGLRAGAGGIVTWSEHMLKGVASLGLLGFLKVVYLLGPSSWWNLRSSGIGAGMGRTGRDRAAQISWIVVAIGVINFFIFTWGQVGGLVKRWMERAAEEILEVGQESEDKNGRKETKAE